MTIFLWTVIGASSGWIVAMTARHRVRRGQDLVLGIIGAFIGGAVMDPVGPRDVTGVQLYGLLAAVFGAVTLIYLGRRVRHMRNAYAF